MNLRPNNLVVDHDDAPVSCAAGSVEPMRRPDYKAKKHPRPSGKLCTKSYGGRSSFVRHRCASLDGGV